MCQNNSVQEHFVSITKSTMCIFKENPDALEMIQHQESFEIVNPLGSARSKHRVLAVYYRLGNIDAH